MQEKVDVLQYDNKQLVERVEKVETTLKKKMAELSEMEKENNRRSKEALRRANYNEQYSRKNNIKIANIPEERNEDQEKLEQKVNGILQKQGIHIKSEEILAIHRIPTKKMVPDQFLVHNNL